MAGPTLFQVKRTSVAGREANTTYLPTVGEMGVNLTDGRMWVANTTAAFEIGANCNVSHITTSLYIGNSSVNTFANSTQVNSTFLQALTAAYVGDNVDITTAGLFIGNTSVNVFANSTIVKLANSTVNTSISVPTSAAYSATNYFLHANGTWVQVSAGGGSTRVYQHFTATAGQSVFTVSGGYTINQIEVFYNGVHLANTDYTQDGSTITLGTGALVGAEIEVAGWISLGSFSPVAAGSDTQIQFNDATMFGGSAGLTFDKTTNNVLIGNTLTVGTATVNSTLSQQSALNVTNQINTATLFVSTSANISSAVINSLGGFHTGTVNATSFSVGTAWTANSILVNTNAINCRNQVNTATLFAATTIDVGANVDLTTSQLLIGNTTANMIVNSITITIANSTGFSQINPSYMYNGNGATQALQSGGTGFWYGNNTTNVTSGTVTPTTPYLQVANSTGSANLIPAGLVVGSTIVNGTVIVSGGSLLSANIQTNPQTGTTYTLAASDSGKVVTCNNASAITVTIPAGLPIGFRTMVMQIGVGAVTLSNTGQTGSLIFSRTSAFTTTARWGTASVSEVASNTYVIDGSI